MTVSCATHSPWILRGYTLQALMHSQRMTAFLLLRSAKNLAHRVCVAEPLKRFQNAKERVKGGTDFRLAK